MLDRSNLEAKLLDSLKHDLDSVTESVRNHAQDLLAGILYGGQE